MYVARAAHTIFGTWITEAFGIDNDFLYSRSAGSRGGHKGRAPIPSHLNYIYFNTALII